MARSIPASAGQPQLVSRLLGNMAVYPRECGATQPSYYMNRSHLGLSPRVRGNQLLAGLGELPKRSIPASAGQPFRKVQSTNASKVYPRECGATAELPYGLATLRGLSPRVRGNRVASFRVLSAMRSIPASAGQPPLAMVCKLPKTVYPRECGATDYLVFQTRTWRGLSPRVRGNPRLNTVAVQFNRSIPASAGQPRPSSTSR